MPDVFYLLYARCTEWSQYKEILITFILCLNQALGMTVLMIPGKVCIMLQVNLFQPRSICFCFCGKQKIFLAPSIFSSSSFSPLPALPTSQPVFFLSQCLPWEPWTTDLWFSFGFRSWCLTIEPCRLGCKFHFFFNYIYIVVVINFLKLFKSDILIKENIPPIITLQYMYLCPNYIQINLTVISN